MKDYLILQCAEQSKTLLILKTWRSRRRSIQQQNRKKVSRLGSLRSSNYAQTLRSFHVWFFCRGRLKIVQGFITLLQSHCLTNFALWHWSCRYLCHCSRPFLKRPFCISIHETALFLASTVNFSFFLLQPFATAPYVFVTAVHSATNKHDAASVWAEDVTSYNFRACLRELKNFDGAHKYLSVVSSCGFYTQIFNDLVEETTFLTDNTFFRIQKCRLKWSRENGKMNLFCQKTCQQTCSKT